MWAVDMEVKVNLFAALKDGAGAGEVHLPWNQGITCRDILEQLKKRFGSLTSLLEHSFVAVNGSYAKSEMLLMPEDEIAVMPPVSGG